MESSARARDPFERQLRVTALLGAIVWLVLLPVSLAPQSGHALIERILLLAPLVIVPLGLRLSAWTDGKGTHPLMFRAAVFLQPFGAIAAVGAVLLQPGMPSAFTAGVWAAYTLSLAAWAIARFSSRRSIALEELCIDAALAYMPIGGAWFVLSRLGSRPMGFSDEIVALTAVHFHFAGFAAPIVAGLAGRVLPSRGSARGAWRIGVIAVATCPIVIAVGITTSPLIEVIASFVLAIALTMLSLIVAIRVARSIEPPLAGVLLMTCAVSLSMTMVLACVYALGEFIQHAWIDVATMAQVHGIANAFGFALPGLIAWTLAAPKPRITRSSR